MFLGEVQIARPGAWPFQTITIIAAGLQAGLMNNPGVGALLAERLPSKERGLHTSDCDESLVYLLISAVVSTLQYHQGRKHHSFLPKTIFFKIVNKNKQSVATYIW